MEPVYWLALQKLPRDFFILQKLRSIEQHDIFIILLSHPSNVSGQPTNLYINMVAITLKK